MRSINATIIGLCSLCIAGCSVGPEYRAPELVTELPQRWQTPLPHNGEALALARWWQQFDDPVLTTLIESAQTNNPTVFGAIASVQEARAALRAAGAGYSPAFTLNGSAMRTGGVVTGGTASTIGETPVATKTATLDAFWELDLFGKTHRNVQSKSARLQASEWKWHDARVSLAAEVAMVYTNVRQCEQMLDLFTGDLTSRRETNRLTGLKLNAGFMAPADAARSEASVAESESTLENQKGTCQRYQNQLVALTGLSYPNVIEYLAKNPARIPLPGSASISALPAELITQRPDVAASERALAAVSAEIGAAIADRLPALTLNGSIGFNATTAGAFSDSTKTWSFGPSLSLPIFDAGRRRAEVDAARARYDGALSNYKQTVIIAVREVEDALVRVDTAARRLHSADTAAHRYADYFLAIDQKYRHGGASLLELEEARRTTLVNQETLLAVQLEMSQSWIALYKAAGGGWQELNTAANTYALPNQPDQIHQQGSVQ